MRARRILQVYGSGIIPRKGKTLIFKIQERRRYKHKVLAIKVNNGNEKYSATSMGRTFCYKTVNLKKKLM